jgi:hypothetical protein
MQMGFYRGFTRLNDRILFGISNSKHAFADPKACHLTRRFVM